MQIKSEEKIDIWKIKKNENLDKILNTSSQN